MSSILLYSSNISRLIVDNTIFLFDLVSNSWSKTTFNGVLAVAIAKSDFTEGTEFYLGKRRSMTRVCWQNGQFSTVIVFEISSTD
jgi:hypothetical protein